MHGNDASPSSNPHPDDNPDDNRAPPHTHASVSSLSTPPSESPSSTHGLVPVLGGVSAASMAAMFASGTAVTQLAETLTHGKTRHTLQLLARLAVARSAANLLLLPAIARLADRYGRKVVLVTTTVLTGLGHALTAAVPTAATLVLGQALQGALGIGGANDAIRDAALGDTLHKSDLSAAIARARAWMALGMVVGPLMGGTAAKRSPRLPFALAATMCFGGALLAMVGMPETLTPARQRATAMAQQKEGGTFALKVCLNPVSSIELFRHSARLRWLTVACALSMGSDFNAEVMPLLCRDRLGWDAVDMGKFTASGGVLAVTSSAMCGALVRGVGPRVVTLAGTSAQVLRCLRLATARNDTAMYSSLLGILFGGMTMRLSSLMALHSDAAVMDGLGGAEAAAMRGNSFALMRMAVPVVMTRLYGPGTEGAPFVLSAVMAATSLALASTVVR
eukprot:m.212848 g.212848  ORF g.212848 m.212848 type:complete len:450 (+) comp26265_c0_seq1:53-1402(+)